VLEETSGQYQYSATVQGHRGRVIVRVGKYRSQTVPEGYELAVDGGDKGAYTVYIRMDEQGIDQITRSDSPLKGEKFLRDGQLLIQVGENVYDVIGNKIQ
jgi:hypothetical protein